MQSTTITSGGKETIELGRKIGKTLKPHDIIALTGELGAGKTTLIQGIAQELGVKDYVTSPSFTLINEYKACLPARQGKLPLYHIDLYRLGSEEQIRDLGIEEYFDKEGIVIIEWAERMGSLLPINAIKITIEVIDESTRNIKRN